MKQKIIRITTIPGSLKVLLKGQLRFMNQHYEVIGVSGDGEALDDVRNNEGVRTEVIEMTRTISPLKDLIATYKLYKLLKKEQPHIVHSHTPKAGIVGMLAARLAGVKHRFHTIAGMPLLEAKGIKRQLLNFVEKLTYACATKVFPNSYGLYDIVISEKFAKKEKLHVIGNGSSNGIDVSHFDPEQFNESQKDTLRQELGISSNDLVFIFVGRLVKDKGINELITAYDEFHKTNPNSKLLLVGWRESHLDPLDDTTEALLENHSHIIEAGYQSDVRPYFSIADILVFPSYREGFPNVVLQAGAMGLPSIVSNINGCNEIIEDNVNGLIIPVKNKEAIFKAMNLLSNNHELRQNMMSISRQIIVKRFQHTYIWNELLKVYQNTK